VCDLDTFLWSACASRAGHLTKGVREYLGCDKEDLRVHIEALMSPAMNWSDYGTLWQIDHIIPFCEPVDGAAPTIEDKLARMHYTNLQPIWTWAHKEKTAVELKKYVK